MHTDLPKHADVVVVGAVHSAAAAFHLAQAGCKGLVLLDRGPIASGTTPFAAGQTGHLPTDGAMVEFVNYCVDFLENFEKHTGYSIDFRQPGSIRIALTPGSMSDLEARMTGAKQSGQLAEMITLARAKEMAPLLELENASGILYAPRDGYVEPKSVAVAFAAAAQDRGAVIRANTDVLGFEFSGGELHRVRTSRGTIEARWVVLAAGAWTRHIAARAGCQVKSVPVRHQAFVTAPIRGVVGKQPIVRIIEPQLYVRPEAGGLLVGGYGYRPTSFEMSEFPDNFEMPALEADQIYYSQLMKAACRFFPVLQTAPVVQERRGLPTISPDTRLIVSELDDMPGVIVASACGVGGIFQSPGVGRAVADLVTGRQSSLAMEVLQANRFSAQFDDDADLRARCEEVYARMYLPSAPR